MRGGCLDGGGRYVFRLRVGGLEVVEWGVVSNFFYIIFLVYDLDIILY